MRQAGDGLLALGENGRALRHDQQTRHTEDYRQDQGTEDDQTALVPRELRRRSPRQIRDLGAGTRRLIAQARPPREFVAGGSTVTRDSAQFQHEADVSGPFLSPVTEYIRM